MDPEEYFKFKNKTQKKLKLQRKDLYEKNIFNFSNIDTEKFTEISTNLEKKNDIYKIDYNAILFIIIVFSILYYLKPNIILKVKDEKKEIDYPKYILLSSIISIVFIVICKLSLN
jgi:hypothetical protein